MGDLAQDPLQLARASRLYSFASSTPTGKPFSTGQERYAYFMIGGSPMLRLIQTTTTHFSTRDPTGEERGLATKLFPTAIEIRATR